MVSWPLRFMRFAVCAAGLWEIAAGRAILRFAGAVLRVGIVLVAVAAGGVGLAFAAGALARDAQALGGVGEGEGGEEEKRGECGEDAAAERDATGAGEGRNEKGHAPRVLGEVARTSDWRRGAFLARGSFVVLVFRKCGGGGPPRAVRGELSAVSDQRSAVSDQGAAFSCQLSAVSFRLAGTVGLVWLGG